MPWDEATRDTRCVASQLQRPTSHAGVGPQRGYRAVHAGPGVTAATLQIPQQWVRQQPAFTALTAALANAGNAAAAAAQLHALGFQDVEKVWTELAYEAARMEIDPLLPSRLDSLWLFTDPLEAFSFTEETGENKAVFECEINAGVPWILADMDLFRIERVQTPTEDAYIAARARAEALAVLSPYDLRGLGLLPWLRQHGVVL